MIGTKPSGEPVITKLQAEIATPDYFAQNHSISTDSVKTIIRWDKFGTTIYGKLIRFPLIVCLREFPDG